MRFNTRGDLIEGRERYWLNNDTWIEQVGTDATGWHVQASDGTILDPNGAAELKAGGGKWAGWPPPRGNFGPLPDASVVADIGLDGTVALCLDRQAGGPIMVEGDSRVHDIKPRSVRAVGRGHIVCSLFDRRIWSNVLGDAALPAGVTPFSAVCYDGWLLYHTHRWLVFQKFSEPLGVVVAEAPTYAPDMVRLPDGRFKVAWSPNPAEMLPSIAFIQNPALTDLRNLSDVTDNPTPAPVPPPTPQPEPGVVMRLPDDVYATFTACVQKFPHTGSDDERRVAMEKAVQTIRARHGLRYVWKTEHSNLSAPSKDGMGYVPDGVVTHGERMRMFIWDMINGTTRQPNPQGESEPIREAYVLTPEPKDWLAAPQPEPEPQPQPVPQPPPPSEDINRLWAAITELTGRLEALERKPDPVVTLPRLRVKGKTANALYHQHMVDLEVIQE